MAHSENIRIYQYDHGYDIEFNLTNPDGTPADLTDSTAYFLVQRPDEGVNHIEAEMTIVSADEGNCKYTVQENDFEDSGVCYAQVRVDFDDGKVVTYGDFTISVLPALPKYVVS